ncbi:MAG: hypothetical protein ACI9WU_002875, partial [Myxococcota bacterium]
GVEGARVDHSQEDELRPETQLDEVINVHSNS